MRTYKIDTFIFQNSDENYITRFGGQPDWIASPNGRLVVHGIIVH